MKDLLSKMEKEKIEKYYDIVKKHINILDYEGLIETCGENEYKKEIEEICIRISPLLKVEYIAKVLYVIFSFYFSINDVTDIEYFMETAKNIKEDIDKL